MLSLTKSEKQDDPEFKWGKIKGHGGNNIDVQFYESFTYDGFDYSLYDCVYMYKHGEPAPYIGKLTKMWETAEGNNNVEVHWFFRPSEISYYLKNTKVLENELFFATGDGKGLANLNPLEAIAGKCNVVCTSSDRRNPQPSAKELQMADYVFCRIFDVKSCTISDHMDDKVGGLEVNFVFNRREGVRTLDSPKLDSDEKYEARHMKQDMWLPNQIPKSVPNNKFNGSGQSEKPVQSLSTSARRPMEVSAQESMEKSNPGHDKCRENDEGPVQTAKPLQILSSSMKRTSAINLGHDKSSENKVGSGQGAKPLQSFATSVKRTLEKSNLRHDKSFEKEQILPSSSCPKDGGYLKKAKLDNSIKRMEVGKNNKIKNLKDDNTLAETKSSPKCVTSSDNNVKSRPDMGRSNEYHDARLKVNVGETKNMPKFVTGDNKEESRIGERLSKAHHNGKDDKLLNDNLPNPSASKSKDDGGKVVGKIIEVTPRPPDKPTWMKFSWDYSMKAAHDQGRLVLLQNLDPEYTSGEVEDIIWHTFQGNCKARIIPHSAISNPYSGQAFVVFKSRGAANKVVQKLDDECLMLPNQRPLVACHAVLPKSGKQTFFGHFVIDKGRRQIQRDMKEALSTSHYSQHNTIEYTMAMDWCVLQLKSDKWWEDLHEMQWNEIKKLRENLKSN